MNVKFSDDLELNQTRLRDLKQGDLFIFKDSPKHTKDTVYMVVNRTHDICFNGHKKIVSLENGDFLSEQVDQKVIPITEPVILTRKSNGI